MSTLKPVEDHLLEFYDLHFNVVNHRTYFKKKSVSEWTKIEDYELNTIHREILNVNIPIGKRQLSDLLMSDFVNKYDPFQEYFNSLPDWDKKTDHIALFLDSIKTNNDVNFRWAFKKWFVAMIACALDKKPVNQTALILIGKQGVGKSTWIENLIPFELKNYVSSGMINPADKDTVISLSECILINMEEMGSFSTKQVEVFKEIITKSTIKLRRAYGTYSKDFIRRASFIGSTNNKALLKDVTGNRRFLVFEAQSFYSNVNFDIDKIYAQAYQLWKDGFQYWFDSSDQSTVNLINEQYRQIEPEEEYFLKYFEKAKKTETSKTLRLSPTEIIKLISSFEKQDLSKTLSVIKMGKYLNAIDTISRNKKYQIIKK
ncbi:MAG: hypothetical protein CML02_15535 [Pseudooceanicola sp.]|nr:hypothetical protein [Pseudooceanicola sp.]|tara:strand:+ start:5931 stop:7049 length:1119 start_codon:yes stop_codon:yes gene_type:complete